jgi:undecaprenyl diphosphate synthase
MTHVAIIMDGNGRWAKQQGKPRIFGHQQGVEALHRAVSAAPDLGITHLSVYAFSTENWKRPDEEVSFLMGLFVKAATAKLKALCENGVRLRFLGDLHALPDSVQQMIQDTHARTENNSRVQLNIMMNYGSHSEIVHAAQRVTHLQIPLTEASLTSHLYTAGIPDPDILIRTGGDCRLSNFMLWQLAYTELFFLDVLWPDFNQVHLQNVLTQFRSRERRFGGLTE